MKRNFFERVEEAFVYRTARTMFLVAAVIALVAAIGGFVRLGWGLTPAEERAVPKPPEPPPVALSADDIQREIEAANAAAPVPAPQPAAVRAAPAPGADEVAFNLSLDAFKALMPAPLYTYQSNGRRYGLADTLDQLLSGRTFSEKKKIVGLLCDVLEKFPEAERLAPFQTFARLYSTRESARVNALAANATKYQSDLVRARGEYEATVARKAAARYQGLIIVGAAIAALSLVTIVLVLLSLQRMLGEIRDSATSTRSGRDLKRGV